MIYYSEHVAEANVQTTVSEQMQRSAQIPAPRMMPRGRIQSDIRQNLT